MARRSMFPHVAFLIRQATQQNALIGNSINALYQVLAN